MSSSAAVTHCGADFGLRVDTGMLAATLVIALPLAALFWLSASVSLFVASVAMVLTTLVILSTGFALLRTLDAPDASPAAAWVLGVFATSLALYALVQWLELRATTAAVVWAVPAGGLVWRLGLWRTRIDVRQLLGIVLPRIPEGGSIYFGTSRSAYAMLQPVLIAGGLAGTGLVLWDLFFRRP